MASASGHVLNYKEYIFKTRPVRGCYPCDQPLSPGQLSGAEQSSGWRRANVTASEPLDLCAEESQSRASKTLTVASGTRNASHE